VDCLPTFLISQSGLQLSVMPRSIRDIAIILLLIGGGLLILFSSSKESEPGVVSRVVYTVLRPVQQVIFAVHSRATNLWNGYIALTNVRAEDEALKEEIRRLRRENALLQSKESENRRLAKLLDLKTRYEYPSLVAQIVGEDATGWYKTMFINRGSEDGVGPEMAVTVAQGIVGRVVKTTHDMSRVLLLTDPNLTVDCRVARTRDRGLLSGSLERGCVLRYISLKSVIAAGDEVVTSGLDGIFPRGLPVGKIESVRKGAQGLFLEANVIPAVDFSEIEEVLVILGRKGGFDVQPGLEGKR
jgi:rod shape-determining protein MreC